MLIKFHLLIGIFVTLAVAFDNAFKIPEEGYKFTTDESATLTWAPSTPGTVTLKLQWGSKRGRESEFIIAARIPNSGNYQWTPPAGLESRHDYTISIESDIAPDTITFLPHLAISHTRFARNNSNGEVLASSHTPILLILIVTIVGSFFLSIGGCFAYRILKERSIKKRLTRAGFVHDETAAPFRGGVSTYALGGMQPAESFGHPERAPEPQVQNNSNTSERWG